MNQALCFASEIILFVNSFISSNEGVGEADYSVYTNLSPPIVRHTRYFLISMGDNRTPYWCM